MRVLRYGLSEALLAESQDRHPPNSSGHVIQIPHMCGISNSLPSGRKTLGKLLNRSQFAIGQWINTYRQRGLNGLLHLNYRGGNLAPSIPVDIQGQLKEKLAQPEGFPSYKAVQVWLKETQGVGSPVFNRVRDHQIPA